MALNFLTSLKLSIVSSESNERSYVYSPGLKIVNIQTLMGRSIGVNDSYYRITVTDLLADYEKAIPYFVLDDSNKLREKTLSLEQKQAEIAYIKLEHQKQINALRVELEPLLTLKDTLIREGVLKEHHHLI
jgi:hypothetical protein